MRDETTPLGPSATADGFVAPTPEQLASWRTQFGELLELDYGKVLPGLTLVCRYPTAMELKKFGEERVPYERIHNFVVALTLWPAPQVLLSVLQRRAGLVNSISAHLLDASGWTVEARLKNL